MKKDTVNLFLLSDNEKYQSKCGNFIVKREYGITPKGNQMGGWWVFRSNNKLIDFDQFRHDLAERNNLNLIG